MIYQDIEIIPEDIKAIIPWNSRLLLRPIKKYAPIASNLKDTSIRFFVVVDDIDEESIRRLKFEHIKYIKTLPDPADRVADYEIRDADGLPDFDREAKLIESRKTRKEKEDELNEDMQLIKDCERLNLDTTFLKDNLRAKMLGG